MHPLEDLYQHTTPFKAAEFVLKVEVHSRLASVLSESPVSQDCGLRSLGINLVAMTRILGPRVFGR